MARNMAMAVTVKTVENIEGKDRIGLAVIKENGYKVIVSKADVHEGDVVAWFDSDSILPDEEQYKFLRERCWKEKLAGYLIKTMRMGPAYSQGLIMTFAEVGIKPCKAGKDLTSILKVRKYEPADDASPTDSKMPKWKKWLKNFLLSHNTTRPLGKKLFLFNKGSGEFPVHLISKSDEDNIMLHQNWFDKYKNEKCVITVKMEGQSCVEKSTIIDTDKGQFTIGEIVDNKIDCKVKSYNHLEDKIEYKEIEQFQRNKTSSTDEWFELEFEDGRKLKITGNDSLFLPELNIYRKVSEIFNSKDKIFDAYLANKLEESMETIKLKSIRKIDSPGDKYELSIKDNHNFFVNGILKHNCTAVADKNAKKKFEFKCFGRNSIGRDDHYKYFNLKGLDKALVQYAEQNGLENIAIQGEWCASEGSGFKSVQGGPYRNGADFYVYKVNKNGKTVDWLDLVHTCDQLSLRTVPLISVFDDGFGKIWNSVEEMQEASEHLWYKPGEAHISVYDDRNQELHGKFSRHEGFVVCGYNKGDWSFKVKSQGYAVDGIGKIKEL